MRTGIICLLLALTFQTARAEKTIVGAIRWDAYHGSKGEEGAIEEKVLGLEKWHYRLPFFAKIIGKNKVTIDGSSQEVMDQEIRYASKAGLDYWAFDIYREEEAMSIGIRNYLKSKIRWKINFCMLEVMSCFCDPKLTDYTIRLMQNPQYQKVLDGRPLIYIGFSARDLVKHPEKLPKMKEGMKTFRQKMIQAGLKKPYIVFMEEEPPLCKKMVEWFDGDAISAYCHFIKGINPYSELAKRTEKNWDERKATGCPTIPIVMTGFDARPRIDTPVPWIKMSSLSNQMYVKPGKPKEIADHLKHALDWLKVNSVPGQAQAVIIYAWNEHDEGGWICPTLFEGKARLDAIAKILKK